MLEPAPRHALSRPFITGFLVILCFIAAYCRVHGSGEWHVNSDEINHIELAQGESPGEVVRFSLLETHPPLGHLLRHYWMTASDAPWFLRSLSLLFGLALIPLFYRIGKELGGDWAGIGCAALAAFSHALIVQSYLVRNYTLLLLLLSLCLYLHLLWRKRPSPALLLLYTLSGSLAALTHFSALFAVFALTAAELPRIRRFRSFLPWLAANLLIACVSGAMLIAWHPALAHIAGEAHAIGDGRFDWFFPVFCLDYFFVYRPNAAYALFASSVILYAPAALALRMPSARNFAGMAALAVCTSLALQACSGYTPLIPRRNLWLVPFLLPPLGCLLGLLCARLETRLPRSVVMALLTLAGCLSYSPAARYGDPHEYMITNAQWNDFTASLRTLKRHQLIVLGRGDAFLITYPEGGNLYREFLLPGLSAASAFAGSTQAVWLPYYDTRLLFRPFNFGYDESDNAAMIAQAEAKHQLADVDTLIFPSTLWTRAATLAWLLCPALEKTILTFPPSPQPPDADAIADAHAIVLEISKRVFMDDLLSTTGKAHGCLGSPSTGTP